MVVLWTFCCFKKLAGDAGNGYLSHRMAVPSATTDERMHYPQKHRRTEYQGTYPISREDKIKLDLWMSTRYEGLPEPSSNEADEMGVVPSFSYRDVPIYGDTADIMGMFPWLCHWM